MLASRWAKPSARTIGFLLAIVVRLRIEALLPSPGMALGVLPPRKGQHPEWSAQTARSPALASVESMTHNTMSQVR